MNKRILCLSLIYSYSQANGQNIYINPGRTVIVDVNLDGYNGEFDTGKNHVWNGLSLAKEHNYGVPTYKFKDIQATIVNTYNRMRIKRKGQSWGNINNCDYDTKMSK